MKKYEKKSIKKSIKKPIDIFVDRPVGLFLSDSGYFITSVFDHLAELVLVYFLRN